MKRTYLVSPEQSGIYICPKCGNDETFEGTDSRICGTQVFGINRDGCTDSTEPTDIDWYDSYDSEIGGYSEIRCGECQALIWNESMDPPPALVARALEHLREARKLLKLAGAPRSLERVRSAISSAKGAQRHASHWQFREERQLKGPEARCQACKTIVPSVGALLSHDCAGAR